LASAEEIQELTEWYRTGAYQDVVFPDDEEAVEKRMLLRLNNEINPSHKKAAFFSRWVAAAAILFVTSIGGYFLLHKPEDATRIAQSIPKKNSILPGSNKAVLTLAGGKRIELTSAKNGQLATQGNTVITKAADGQIVYNTTGNSTQPINNYNTVTTPNGGQYQIVLPDGTQVWLNAASSITYPAVFAGKERLVQLSGEAYFEVAKNPSKPFRVNVNGKQQVEVLGTHFNIEGYADDSNIKTTLLEGSVKLSYKAKSAMLKPGQMAVNDLDRSLFIKQADIEEVMAWKNGLFVFNDENIKDAMKKAARWYDVDIEYRGNILKKKLGGTVSRYKNITDLLDNISKTGTIHYKLQGRRVILMN
jgi:ferric-dicitrate binding protein FerR (iron transport regulator)